MNDFQTRIQLIVEEGLTKVADEKRDNDEFRKKWLSKQRGLFDAFTAAKDLLSEKLGRASAGRPKGEGGPVALEVAVNPAKLPGEQDLADPEVTYSLTFTPDPKARKVVWRTSPESLSEAFRPDVPPGCSFDVGYRAAPSPEEWVTLFVKVIMADLARRAVR